MSFLQLLLEEIGERCGVSTSRDFKEISARVEHEGISFLTISLARFGKDFTKALDEGRVDPNHFSRWSKSGSTPRFLGGMLDLVFDRRCGTLLDEPSLEAIRGIRQVTLAFAKIGLQCSREREELALTKFVEIESEILARDPYGAVNGLRERFRHTGKVLFREMFTEIDRKIYYNEIVPGHGPGATADRLLGNEKYDLAYWPRRMDDVFPFLEYAVPSWSAFHRADEVNFAEPGDEIPVKVTLVPKTLETPRIIAIEPTAVQYMQQGIKDEIYAWVKNDHVLSPMIGFEDQVPNQLLAIKGSLSGEFATLDLSEASDRVSNQHVRDLLADHPWLDAGVQACRSTKAAVPGKGVITLAKFASMGSALCFPMEAIVFLTVVFLTISEELNVPLTRNLVKDFRAKVRVYGDDIIVPVEFATAVAANLALFGYKVNGNKSFWTEVQRVLRR